MSKHKMYYSTIKMFTALAILTVASTAQANSPVRTLSGGGMMTMTDKPNLKPCPAGHEACVSYEGPQTPAMILCHDGKCRWFMERAIGQTAEELYEMWNTRAESQEADS